MRRTLASLAIAASTILVAGCGGANPTLAPAVTRAPAATDDAGIPAQPTQETGTGVSGGPAGGSRATGAKIRVFNGYSGADGKPVALDLYGLPWVEAGVTPLASVEFGAVSAPIDPGAMDEAGDAFLSAYAKGESGNGNNVMSNNLTLAGNEQLLYLVGRGTGTMGNGRPGAISQQFSAGPAATDAATPAAGKGRVMVSAVGLDTVVGRIDETWEVSFGSGCARDITATESSWATVGPGTGGTSYDLAPGSYTFSLHPQASDATDRTCAGAALVTAPGVTVAAGKTTVVFLYAANPKEIKAAAIPLDAP